ncbi:MAG: methylmalonyl Co-A mutase-associated GTPase MeaB, partial [Eudoraea sp.]|nr:methylmalonyl Co-A mutase-associated GTPase MeaB [Eudoraea sp.]
GYDIILVETVGVGQSETAVHSMVDFFLLLKLAGAGDELQGIKRGIIEMADAIVINKAEGANAERAKLAQTEFSRALHLYPLKSSEWQPEVLTCSAINNTGISEIWEMIQQYFKSIRGSGYLETHRSAQNKQWLIQHLEDVLRTEFFSSKALKKQLNEWVTKVENHAVSPFKAAELLLAEYRKELK